MTNAATEQWQIPPQEHTAQVWSVSQFPTCLTKAAKKKTVYNYIIHPK